MIMGEFIVAFVPGTDGAVDLVVTEHLAYAEPVERMRLGFRPEELDRLLAEGREAVYAALGVALSAS